MHLYARFAEYFIERMKVLEQTIKYNVLLEKKVKERTEQLTDALKNAYKLNKIKSKFLSIASHELKTPLSSILSSIYLIEQYNKNEHAENRNKHLKRIEGNIKNLLTVIDDFLSIEKIEIQKIGIKKKHFNLFELIENITDELKLISKYNQSIFFSSKGHGMIYSDEKIVRNLITNILSNAIKYSEENIFINACKTGSTFKIEIKDSGIGIPSEDKKYIFNSYFRATNASGVKGTGLGLNIVKKYIEILGGTINFKSNENFGTTFYLKLPEN
jgi:signal transduction histidine kinase